MSFDRKDYIKEFNKNNYKMYQFRVKKGSDHQEFLDHIKERNKLLLQMIDDYMYTLSIHDIKIKSKPIFEKYGINDVYLFGSYSRGDAHKDSDVDFYCEKGNIKSLFDLSDLSESLKENLGKDVDIVLFENKIPAKLLNNIKEDMIRLW